MVLGYDFGKSLLLIDPRCTKEYFLNKIGAEKGYSLQMFSKMFDSIFSELINIDREYNKYYAFEYESLPLFLYKKYNIKANHIKELFEERKKYPNCILFRTDYNSYGDYGIAQFTFSDTMYKRITDILMFKNLAA